MNKSRSQRGKTSSVKTAVAFIAIVFVIVVMILAVRFIITVQKSVFDGQHQFTLLLNSSSKESLVAVFTPSNKSVDIIPLITSSKDTIGKDLHIGIDGKVSTFFPIHDNPNISNILLQTTFKPQYKTQITWYDLFRFYLMTKTADVSYEKTVHLPKEALSQDVIAKSLFDPDIVKESSTIQIINGSDQSGLGSRLEKVIANMGGNVIDIRTSPVDLGLSKIRYYGKISYTVARLQRILHFGVEQEDQQGISDIEIIIGKDNQNTNTF